MRKMGALALLLTLLCACAAQPKAAQAEFFAMDAPMSLTAYGDGAEDFLLRAQREVFRLESLLSRTRPDSEIAALNEKGIASLTPDTAEVLAAALRAAHLTDGAFDPTVAPVMDAWGFGAAASFEEGTYRVPAQGELDALLPLVDYEALTVTADTAAVGEGMAVDLGGVAKGYAADKVTALCKEAGITSALFTTGSTVAAIGTKPDGTAWRVGVKDPQNAGESCCVLSLADAVTSTSGAYERHFEANGVTYHHILDPQTGMPAHSGLLSVTVVSPDGALTDALSTACFVLGREASLELWRERGEELSFDLLLVGEDNVVTLTAGLEGKADYTQGEGGYTYEVVSR